MNDICIQCVQMKCILISVYIYDYYSTYILTLIKQLTLMTNAQRSVLALSTSQV